MKPSREWWNLERQGSEDVAWLQQKTWVRLSSFNFWGKITGSVKKKHIFETNALEKKAFHFAQYELYVYVLYIYQSIVYTWNPKQQLINGCFNWMTPNLYIENGCFTKHPFINGCLGFQVYIHRRNWQKNGSCNHCQVAGVHHIFISTTWFSAGFLWQVDT